MKIWAKESGFPMPSAGCHLSQTRCTLFWRKEADRSAGLSAIHRFCPYWNIRGGVRKCFRNISVHVTFKLRLFQGLFAWPEAQINSPDALKPMNWIFNDCTSLFSGDRGLRTHTTTLSRDSLYTARVLLSTCKLQSYYQLPYINFI